MSMKKHTIDIANNDLEIKKEKQDDWTVFF